MARPCFPDPACRTPDEYGMLAAVLDVPHDDLPKLVYADWLDERGDPRGGLLRRWLARDGGKLPQAVGVSPSWLSVIGYTLDLELERAGHPAWADAVRRTATPALYVRTHQLDGDDDPFPVGASRLGGRPDLPTDAAWADVEALTFVAQWNVADLAASPVCRRLPRTGLLSLFADLESGGWGAAGHVLFTPTPDGLAERRHEAKELAACRVEYVEWMTLPPPLAARLDHYQLSAAASAEYARFFARFPRPAGVVHQLLGHATPTQTCPKSGCEADWTLLCEFGGDEAAGLTTDDGGRWCFLIPERMLWAGRFGEVFLEYQTE